MSSMNSDHLISADGKCTPSPSTVHFNVYITPFVKSLSSNLISLESCLSVILFIASPRMIRVNSNGSPPLWSMLSISVACAISLNVKPPKSILRIVGQLSNIHPQSPILSESIGPNLTDTNDVQFLKPASKLWMFLIPDKSTDVIFASF